MSTELVPIPGLQILEKSPALVYLASLTSADSRRTMRGCLSRLAMVLAQVAEPDRVPWWQLRYAHTSTLRTWLIERYDSPASVNKHLAALRGVLRESWRLGLMSAEDYHRAVELAGVTGSTLPAGRALSAGELSALFAHCAALPGPAGARDAAILAVMFAGGVRRAEVVRLQLDDVPTLLVLSGADESTGALTIRGKGRRDRLVYLAAGGRAALRDWIQVRGLEPGALFVRLVRGGRIRQPLIGIGAQSVWDICRRRALGAKIERFTPHDLRRTFVSGLLDAGVDLATVQRLAGHASVTTTTRYDHRGEESKREAAQLLHVPYVPQETDDD